MNENSMKTENTIEDIINLNAVNDASQPEKRETTLQRVNALLTDQSMPRFVDVELPNGKLMTRIATSPREIEWSACATLLKDRAIVVSPWRGAEQAKRYTLNTSNGKTVQVVLPYPILGVRGAAVREIAYYCENSLGSTLLPKEYSGPARSMVPRDRDDKRKPARPFRTYPVATDGFVNWLESQDPDLWMPREVDQRPRNSWILIGEPMGPWGRNIDETWLEVVE